MLVSFLFEILLVKFVRGCGLGRHCRTYGQDADTILTIFGKSSQKKERNGRDGRYAAQYHHGMTELIVSQRPVRARRPARRYLLSPSKAALFTVEFLLLALFSSVPDFGMALALAVFTGLVYARQNLAVIAPAYIVSAIIFNISWWTLLYAAVPVVLFMLLYFAFFRMRKNVPLVLTSLVALVGMIPYAVCTVVFGGDYVPVIISLIIVAVFSFCAQILCYAVLLRGINTRFTLDEMICGGIAAVVASFAFMSVDIEGFSPFYLIAPFIIMFFAVCRKPVAAFVVSVLLGLGASFAGGDISIVAVTILWGTAAVMLSNFTRFASGAGILAVEAALWLLTEYAGSGWRPLVLMGVGIIAFWLIPKGGIARMSRGAKNQSSASLNGIVNRNRGEMSSRLYSVSEVFYDLSSSLADSESAESYYTAERLAKEIAKNYCGRCLDREECFSSLGGDTAPVLEPMAKAVLSRGKVTILDMPPFVTSRCKKMHNLVSVINNAGVQYRDKRQSAGGAAETKRLMSEQFAGIALVLDSLAKECGEHISFGDDVQFTLGNELLKHNIVASEIIVAGQESGFSVTLTVRECDANKAVLPRIVSSMLKMRLEVAGIGERGEERVVHLVRCPAFEVAYGVAEKKRNGEGVSGDTKSILCPSRRRRLFAISDGMGSGEGAAGASKRAISMVENFYRAGFDNAIILSLVNKLLGIGGEENFSSLDIAVVDTVSGGMDLIKMGAASTFVIHRETVDVIESAAPPAGILDKVQPVTSRRQLYDGDMVIMMSDGVFDVLEERGIIGITEELRTSNPQTLADRILARALDKGASDDCSVIAMRLVAA